MAEKSLMGILMEVNSSTSASLLASLRFAVLPIVKVFTMCFMGFLMASKYINILPPNGRKLLNGLVFSLLLPCLIFSELGRAITLQKILQWWFIPVNVVLGSISGSIIGLVVASIIRPPYPYFKFTIIHIGIGNIGNIPLVLLAAICRDASNPFGDTCSQAGIAYISFGQWVGAIILYTYVFQMLAPPPGETFDSIHEPKLLPTKAYEDESSPEKVPLLTPADPERETVITAKVPTLKDRWNYLVDKFKLKQIFQPPIVASILAIGIGVVPFLKNLVLTDDAPLFFFTDSCLILGEAMIPCILLALGGNLVDGPGVGFKRLGLKTTIAIIFARLVLVPPAGLGIVTLADKLNLFPKDDKMFKFVLLIQHSMPTSVLSGAVSNLRGCGKESATILFWVHIFAVFSMAGWMILFLRILF
ncbi:Auxin efflux carrier family protein-like [Rhynchospora pubera]|uniref:Auxin efflux carrier family protein-like n=1 Tax=Rhynchospora pubera TaxID=906938 RepID=A0AAV8DDH5_9POAL|nr:Auxin efflux carrier family protein-like [Rhynchospora pubera]